MRKNYLKDFIFSHIQASNIQHGSAANKEKKKITFIKKIKNNYLN